MPGNTAAGSSRTARRTGEPATTGTRAESVASDLDDVEEVQVQQVAVDPGGETRDAEQPAGGYPSDNENDAPPLELREEPIVDDEAGSSGHICSGSHLSYRSI
jgi:hypothetical protein